MIDLGGPIVARGIPIGLARDPGIFLYRGAGKSVGSQRLTALTLGMRPTSDCYTQKRSQIDAVATSVRYRGSISFCVTGRIMLVLRHWVWIWFVAPVEGIERFGVKLQKFGPPHTHAIASLLRDPA
ncbi:hypothetical protein KM043_005571 [Ampulex compressa]|nr:hypothetical protein KM043_005571 [Ampulex compressa]